MQNLKINIKKARKVSKRKVYLKVRQQICSNCQGIREVVVRGITNNKRKDQPYTERIVGFRCNNCKTNQPIWLKN